MAKEASEKMCDLAYNEKINEIQKEIDKARKRFGNLFLNLVIVLGNLLFYQDISTIAFF